jgi:hypothetical protein
VCSFLKRRKTFYEDKTPKTLSWFQVLSVACKVSTTEEWHKEQNCYSKEIKGTNVPNPRPVPSLIPGYLRNSGSKSKNCPGFYPWWTCHTNWWICTQEKLLRLHYLSCKYTNIWYWLAKCQESKANWQSHMAPEQWRMLDIALLTKITAKNASVL